MPMPMPAPDDAGDVGLRADPEIAGAFADPPPPPPLLLTATLKAVVIAPPAPASPFSIDPNRTQELPWNYGA